jgi:ribonucleoside-diphosphate reductase alpha chain
MRIERRFTKQGQSAYAEIEFRKATSEIKNPDGSIVFRLADIDVPAQFSQVATDVLAQKYFRKAGVPARLKKVEETSVPSWLWRSVPDEADSRSCRKISAHRRADARRSSTASPAAGPTGAGRAATSRRKKMPAPSTTSCASCWPSRCRAELAAVVQHRPALGLWHRRPGQGHFYVDPFTGKLTKSKSAYEHPQPHACFIQSVADDLVNEGGIMDLWVREARLFKYGSGTGSNFSHLRGEGEKLSGGGKSSGLMSFLKIGDRAAGAIKSGGTTRRAAKMVVDADHPDIEAFIDWKVKEEQKVAALVTGSKIVKKHLPIMAACVNCEARATTASTRQEPGAEARDQAPPRRWCRTTTSSASSSSPSRATTTSTSRPTTPTGIRGLPHRLRPELEQLGLADRRFPARRRTDGDWKLTARTTGKVTKTVKARDLGQDRPRRLGLGRSRHPVQHHHERLAHLPGAAIRARTRARNTCSSTTPPATSPRSTCCPSATDGKFDVEAYEHAVPALDRGARDLGDDGAVPVEGDRRTLLRLPHARPRLRQHRRPADDHGPRLRLRRRPRLCGALTAIMTGVAYATSAEMAKELGPSRLRRTRHMLRVIRNHRRRLWRRTAMNCPRRCRSTTPT